MGKPARFGDIKVGTRIKHDTSADIRTGTVVKQTADSTHIKFDNERRVSKMWSGYSTSNIEIDTKESGKGPKPEKLDKKSREQLINLRTGVADQLQGFPSVTRTSDTRATEPATTKSVKVDRDHGGAGGDQPRVPEGSPDGGQWTKG